MSRLCAYQFIDLFNCQPFTLLLDAFSIHNNIFSYVFCWTIILICYNLFFRGLLFRVLELSLSLIWPILAFFLNWVVTSLLWGTPWSKLIISFSSTKLICKFLFLANQGFGSLWLWTEKNKQINWTLKWFGTFGFIRALVATSLF